MHSALHSEITVQSEALGRLLLELSRVAHTLGIYSSKAS